LAIYHIHDKTEKLDQLQDIVETNEKTLR